MDDATFDEWLEREKEIGRKVSQRDGYAYPSNLRTLAKNWTIRVLSEERWKDAFKCALGSFQQGVLLGSDSISGKSRSSSNSKPYASITALRTRLSDIGIGSHILPIYTPKKMQIFVLGEYSTFDIRRTLEVCCQGQHHKEAGDVLHQLQPLVLSKAEIAQRMTVALDWLMEKGVHPLLAMQLDERDRLLRIESKKAERDHSRRSYASLVKAALGDR